MTPGFRFDAVVLPGGAAARGEVTLEQIYRYLPIAPSLAVGEIRGEDLRNILEVELVRVFSPDPFEHSGGWLGGFGGLEIDVDLSRPDGERVRSVRLAGADEPIGDDEPPLPYGIAALMPMVAAAPANMQTREVVFEVPKK